MTEKLNSEAAIIEHYDAGIVAYLDGEVKTARTNLMYVIAEGKAADSLSNIGLIHTNAKDVLDEIGLEEVALLEAA